MKTISFVPGSCHVVLANPLERLSWGSQIAFAGRSWPLPLQGFSGVTRTAKVLMHKTSIPLYTLRYVLIWLEMTMMMAVKTNRADSSADIEYSEKHQHSMEV